MNPLVRDPDGSSPEICRLRGRLDEFYRTTTSYPAFQNVPDNGGYYKIIDEFLDPLIADRGRVRVLELGAGRTEFARYLGERRAKVQFAVQDVTDSNVNHLKAVADAVHIGDLSQIDSTYDLIFSTFVLEHVSAPRAFLSNVSRLLDRGGCHLVFCPRYDVPGYLCPSLRHLSGSRRLRMQAFLTSSRLLSRIDRRPRFFVNIDPSLFHGPWYRDADAVHIVSRFDVQQWHLANGFRVQRVFTEGSGLRGWFYRRHLTLNLACFKR